MLLLLASPALAGGFYTTAPPACQCRRCKRFGVQSLGQEDPLEKEMTIHPSILA